MRVCVEPAGLFSPAMIRIARALERHAPPEIEIVKSRNDADLVVLYPIGTDYLQIGADLRDGGRQYAAIQCCLKTSGDGEPETWAEFWRNARATWSYYDLRYHAEQLGFKFLHAPLGADPVFLGGEHRDTPTVMTSGSMSGPGCEAIEAVWDAAERANLIVIHTGAESVAGVTPRHRPHVSCVGKVSDAILARYYRNARWVAALRHVEGFEMPAVEGLVSGARPIVFAQHDTAYWYGNLAYYVHDTDDYAEITEKLVGIFEEFPFDVPATERTRAAAIFNWQLHVEKFWAMVLS